MREQTEPTRKNLPAKAGMQIATARNDITIPFFNKVLQPIDATLLERGGGKGLALYDEIERDPHAWAVLQKRKKTLLAREWEVIPGSDDRESKKAADFARDLLDALPFDRICEDLLDATLKGFAISEIVWKRDGDRIVPDRIVAHDQRRFAFDVEWRPRLLTLTTMADGMELPDRKFIVHRHGVKGNNPYGLGLGTRLFWPVLFKREGVAFWLTFLDKFAGPTVLGKVPYGLPKEEEDKVVAVLSALRTTAAVAVPIGTDVSFLEAARAGNVSYQDWCAYWDKQMSICVNGETLTTDIGDTGSRAASDTHEDILQQLVDADGDLLSNTLGATLLSWVTEYNFPGARPPRVWRKRSENEKEKAEEVKARAEAAGARLKALQPVINAAARLNDDREARAYIEGLAPEGLDPETLDLLVKNRVVLANSPPAIDAEDDTLPVDPNDPEGLKKKP